MREPVDGAKGWGLQTGEGTGKLIISGAGQKESRSQDWEELTCSPWKC